MNYEEYTKQRTNWVSKLPLFFAFSDEQLKRALEERHTTTKDIYALKGISGAFYLKSDSDKLNKMLDEPDPLDELMQNPEFATEAFFYELKNYEYCYNTYQGDWDVCSAFTNKELTFNEFYTYKDYLKAMGHPEYIPSFEKALAQYSDYCRELDL